MSGRHFSLTCENQTITTTLPLLGFATSATEINAGGRARIKRVEITQNGTATASMVRFCLTKRDQAATLTWAGGLVPRNLDVGGLPASAFVSGTAGHTPLNCGAAASTDTGGAYVDLIYMNFCNLNGYLYIPTPDEIITVHNTSVFCVKPVAAPGTLTGWTCTIVFEEI